METLSTPSGSKDFVAVATSVHRGEDLAIRGAVCIIHFNTGAEAEDFLMQVYIFEIVEVVPDIELRGKRHHKLKLLCREDAKGPVTALCGMNGYLVSSMGQKVSSSNRPRLFTNGFRRSLFALSISMRDWSELRSLMLVFISRPFDA